MGEGREHHRRRVTRHVGVGRRLPSSRGRRRRGPGARRRSDGSSPAARIGRSSPRRAEPVGRMRPDRRRRPRRRGRDAAARSARTPKSRRSRAAGPAAAGATAFVTLEPCAHVGRTGPCADALIDGRRAPGRRRDRGSRSCGSRAPAFARLRAAGVDVEVGSGAAAAARRSHAVPVPPAHRPSVRGRQAGYELDGKIAAADGTSQWITSAEARADAHTLRADSQAIVIGSGTALADGRHSPCAG